MNLRRIVAPLSVAILILVAGLAVNFHLATRSEYPPPILDPEFELWASDSDSGAGRLMVWNLDYAKGASDQITVQKTKVSERKALEIRIYREETDDSWTYVHLAQKIDGARLRALFDMEAGVWVLSSSTPTCGCVEPLNSQLAIFGIEINDEYHVISYIFSDRVYEPRQFPTRRTIILFTKAGEWTLHTIDLAKEYEKAAWKRPGELTLRIIFEVTGSATGWHAAYVHRFLWTSRPSVTSTQQDARDVAAFLQVSPRGQVIDLRAIERRPDLLVTLKQQAPFYSPGSCLIRV